MLKPTTSASFSDTEQEILEAALRNPEATNADIAEQVGARVALVRDVRAEYEDEVELPEDESLETEPTGSVDADLSATQQAILDAAQADPEATNAEIADETGARITLVRDTLTEHGDDIEPVETESTTEERSKSTGSDELSDTQEKILAYAEKNPDATNAEIADEVGARITLVRDTLADSEGGFEFGGGTGGESSGDSSDSAGDDITAEIREVAEANPEWTNAEIAEEVGARVTLVRDTLSDADYSGSVTTDSDGELPAGVDASVLNPTEQAILETAQANPELTNAEIASKTGTHVAIVRDTRVEYEPGKSADYGGEGVIEEDEADEDEAETTTTTESKEWTPGEPSETQISILEVARNNEELTNSEIAAEVGARLTLVRDTLSDYADVELDELDSDGTSSYEPAEPTELSDLSETEQAILEAVAEDSEQTNSEIADNVGARVTLVRDTRTNYAGQFGTVDSAEAAGASESDDTAAAGAGDEGVPLVRIAILVILLIVLVAVAFALQ